MHIYIDVLPACDLLDAFAHSLEPISSLFEQVVNSFSDSVGIALCAEKRYLVGQP